MASTTEKSSGDKIPSSLKLIIGAGGIYAAFLYYGALQEDVFHYKAANGEKFTQAWFLQALGTLTIETSRKCRMVISWQCGDSQRRSLTFLSAVLVFF